MGAIKLITLQPTAEHKLRTHDKPPPHNIQLTDVIMAPLTAEKSQTVM